MNIPQNIIDDYKKRKLILFLGSGISLGYNKKKGFPSGLELTKLLAQKFLQRDPYPNETLMQTAQQVIWKSNGSRQQSESFILDIFNNPKIHPLQTHVALAKLNLPMITTNFDKLIEEAFKLNNLRLSVIIEDRDLIEYEENILIKVHGCISQVENCIITEEDYYKWMALESEIKNLIRAWFLMFRVVFIGYSLSDINFRQLIVELRRKFGSSFRNPYIVTPNVNKESYNYKFLSKVIGAQFINMDEKSFFEELLSALPKSYKKYTDTDLKEEYFTLNVHTYKSFNKFAAEKIFEKIFQNNAGPLELNEEIVKEIYNIASKKEVEIYIQPSLMKPPKDMVYIPSGEFIMGGSRLGNEMIRVEKINYPYFIDETHVTNKQYREFINWIEIHKDHKYCHFSEPQNKDHHPGYEPDFVPPKDVIFKWLPEDYFTNPEYDDYPVVFIDWWDAYAYANWAGKRLPLEKEWEKAARGIDGRIYPYGNEFNPSRCNVAESNIYHPTPVRKYESGKSPYGCYDMSGNVWDWCSDAFEHNTSIIKVTRVVKGGSCTRGKVKALCSFRNGRHPYERWISRGFRCVKDIEVDRKK